MKNLKKIKLLLLIPTIFIATVCYSQVPAKLQSEPIAIIGGTTHLGNGQVIENSTVVFDNGKIIFAGKSSDAVFDKSKTKMIDVTGKKIYPGFIAANTNIGLTEIGAARATNDYYEVGDFNPNVRSLIAYNTDSKIIPTIRFNGVLMAQSVPQGGIISGTSSIMALDGWNWEDAVYKADDGIHLHWTKLFSYRYSWLEDEEASIIRNNKRQQELNRIENFFNEAKAYSKNELLEKTNLKFESMRGVFDGSKTLYVYADFARDIIDAVTFCKGWGIPKMVIVGGKDAWRVTDILRENNIPVVLFRVHDLPYRKDEDVDISYKVPYLLHEAGVLFCLSYDGGMEATGVRNLAFIAGTAAAYGLTKEAALMAITSNPAKILGIEKSVGTLEVGKDANIIVSSGDALDMRTNNIEYAFIKGKNIDLNNKQKELYKLYSEKYWGQ